MPRWVTINPEAFPIDYKVPGKAAWLHFKLDETDATDKGERFLPDEQANWMIAQRKAVEGRLKGSTARSRKGKTEKRKPARNASNAKASDNGSVNRVDARDLVKADSAGDRSGVDQASS